MAQNAQNTHTSNQTHTPAELLLRRPWLPGNSDIDQLGKIFQALGTPTADTWPGVTQLPNFVEFQKVVPQPLRQQFPQVGGVNHWLLFAPP